MLFIFCFYPTFAHCLLLIIHRMAGLLFCITFQDKLKSQSFNLPTSNFLRVMLILIIIWVAVLIYTYIRIYKRNDLSFLGKLIWIMVIFAAPVAGLIVYHLLSKDKIRKSL